MVGKTDDPVRWDKHNVRLKIFCFQRGSKVSNIPTVDSAFVQHCKKLIFVKLICFKNI